MTIGRIRAKPSATSPLIDWQSPYLDRVAFLTFCNEISPGSLLERVSGRPLSPGTTSSIVDTVYGKAAHLDSNGTSCWGNPSVVPFNTPSGTQTGDVTMLILASIVPEARNSLIIGQSDAALDVCGFSFLANFNSSFTVVSGTLMVDCYNSGDQAISGAGLIDGTFHVYCGRRKGGVLSLFSDGVLIGSVASTIGIVKAGSQLFFGNHIDGTCTGDIAFAIGWNRGLSDQEVKAFSSQLWDTFLLDDTGPASTVTTISGAASETLADATSAATATLLDTGAASPTLAALTSAATATLLDTGSLAKTLGALTSAATGALLDTGALAKTLGTLTSAATATLLDTGSASPTLAALTGAGAATLLDTGSLAKTLGAATSAATATLLDTGAVSATLAPATSAATATVLDTGTLARTLGALTSAATATVLDTGADATTLAALTGAGTGALLIQGSASPTLAALTDSAAATLTDTGALARTLAPVTSAASATLALDAALSEALDAATLNGTSELVVAGSGEVLVTLDGATAGGASVLIISANSDAALSSLTLIADAGLTVSAALATALAPAVLVYSGTTVVQGSASPTLDDGALVADTQLMIGASAAIQLGALTVSADNVLRSFVSDRPLVGDTLIETITITDTVLSPSTGGSVGDTLH